MPDFKLYYCKALFIRARTSYTAALTAAFLPRPPARALSSQGVSSRYAN